MRIPFKWEMLDINENKNIRTARSKVYGGWLINSCIDKQDTCCESMIFIPDPEHQWKI
jgi:hypothetical protein